MLNTAQTIKTITTPNFQSNSLKNETSEIHVPIVPPTSPSIPGSDLFYLIIALTMFTKVMIEAIARLVEIVVPANTLEEK